MAARFDRTLTIGGLPGTGTTTACRALSQRTGLEHVYAGQRFRDLAQASGMTLAEFSAYAEDHPDIDHQLDAWQAEILARGKPVILEGRMSGYLAYRDRRPAYKVWFTCDPYVRGRRLVEREGGDVEEMMERMQRREASEHKRYLEFYGYDSHDFDVYDLVLDTTELPKEAVVEAVLKGYEKSRRPRWWPFRRR